MPGRVVHTWAGVGVALVAGSSDGSRLEGADALFFNAGLGLGGAIGGRLPDLLEPATSVFHRQFFHGVIPAIALWRLSSGARNGAASSLLEWAHRADPGVWGFVGSGENAIPRWLRFLTAGFVKGLPAGYASHLVLDALTPMSLPLVGGFGEE